MSSMRDETIPITQFCCHLRAVKAWPVCARQMFYDASFNECCALVQISKRRFSQDGCRCCINRTSELWTGQLRLVRRAARALDDRSWQAILDDRLSEKVRVASAALRESIRKRQSRTIHLRQAVGRCHQLFCASVLTAVDVAKLPVLQKKVGCPRPWCIFSLPSI